MGGLIVGSFCGVGVGSCWAPLPRARRDSEARRVGRRLDVLHGPALRWSQRPPLHLLSEKSAATASGMGPAASRHRSPSSSLR